MRGTRNRGAVLRLATLAGASVVAAGMLAGAGGAAFADPAPKPPGQAAQAKQHAASRSRAGHTGKRAGHRHARSRSVVRCQNDDTDQVDEIDNDGDEPRHYVSPDATAPAAGCSQDALNLAGLLAGEHRPRAARAVRERVARH